MTDLAARRTEIEGKIGELRQAQGIAVLDGRAFDIAEIERLEAERDGIEAAEGEQVRRDRAEAERARQERKAELRETFSSQLATVIEGVAEAEAGCRMMAAGLTKAQAAAGKAASLFYEIEAKSPPTVLNMREFVSRMSYRIAFVLQTVQRGRYGGLTWHLGPWPKAEAWDAAERKLLANLLNPTRKRTNGASSSHPKD